MAPLAGFGPATIITLPSKTPDGFLRTSQNAIAEFEEFESPNDSDSFEINVLALDIKTKPKHNDKLKFWKFYQW